jgi:hypothetical protein
MRNWIVVPAFVLLACLLPALAYAQGQDAAKQGTPQPKTGQEASQPAQVKPAQPEAPPVSKPAAEGAKPAEAPPPSAGPGAEELKAIEDAYSIKLKGLEEKVNELKEKVFRSKARLLLLQETVLTGKISSAKVNIVHNNELGYFFKLESVSYILDGAPIFNKVDQGGDLAGKKSFDVLPVSNLVAGNHNLTVQLVVRGSGHGFFSYLDEYKFKIKAAVTFLTEEGKITKVKIIPFERGGLTTDLKERPAVRFEVEMKPDIEEKKQLK